MVDNSEFRHGPCEAALLLELSPAIIASADNLEVGNPKIGMNYRRGSTNLSAIWHKELYCRLTSQFESHSPAHRCRQLQFLSRLAVIEP